MIETRGAILGLGAITLGVVSAVFGAYALQWQPVPESWPGAQVGPYVSAGILILAGLATVWKRSATWGARALAVFFGAWVVALHGPRVMAAPTDPLMWLGFCEILAMASGALMLTATINGNTPVKVVARVVFALCPLVFGASHFLYPEFTASMVPAWIPPSQMVWAYATGAGHVAAGLAILTGVLARPAAGLLTLMFASFVVTLHGPRVMADTGNHAEWVMLGVALTLTGAAWAIFRGLSRGAMGNRKAA